MQPNAIPIEHVAHILTIEYIRRTSSLHEKSVPIEYANVYTNVQKQILTQLQKNLL
ncbi:hypothetical protein TAMA11512_21730 [Selenomonas sp. TAMA-11512]|nr:hypothetical protein TAMA11512_21730 [Selenomonas sp. TAMA-11512]